MRNGKTEALGILNKVTRLGFEPTLCAPLPLTLLLGIYTLATAPFHPNGFHSLSSFCLFWPPAAACGILVPQPGIEPGPSVVKMQSPNHWNSPLSSFLAPTR